MFNRKKKEELSQLDHAIAGVLSDMEGYDSDSAEYSKQVDQLMKLHSLKEAEKADKKTVSPDTLAIVAGNLAGIVIIVGFERANVMTSKAVNFLLRLR